MIWHCASAHIAESRDDSRGLMRNVPGKADWIKLTEPHPPMIGRCQGDSDLSIREQEEGDHYNLWQQWVCDYSPRKLTKEQDKLPALAGIARSVATKFHLINICCRAFEGALSFRIIVETLPPSQVFDTSSRVQGAIVELGVR
ncbi:hypothetical protein GJ744_000920 [Endocarpon pusillum]|uniref:Uncharacterized protein n=1 Tax=Endocarpon pusillum TaxID=364733 RepID=A0A8H7ASD5_9EURO|nr:hypothetical protein GJ744_000920 [Endocarpon pusillum]